MRSIFRDFASSSLSGQAPEQPNKAESRSGICHNQTASMLLTGKMTRIVLQAGYVDSSAVLFDGNIIAAKRIRQGTDVIVSIDAGDGDKSYSFAVVQQSIASGYSSADVAKASVTELQAKGARGASVDAIQAETKFPEVARRCSVRSQVRTRSCEDDRMPVVDSGRASRLLQGKVRDRGCAGFPALAIEWIGRGANGGQRRRQSCLLSQSSAPHLRPDSNSQRVCRRHLQDPDSQALGRYAREHLDDRDLRDAAR